MSTLTHDGSPRQGEIVDSWEQLMSPVWGWDYWEQ